jgi:hypothetical protein
MTRHAAVVDIFGPLVDTPLESAVSTVFRYCFDLFKRFSSVGQIFGAGVLYHSFADNTHKAARAAADGP